MEKTVLQDEVFRNIQVLKKEKANQKSGKLSGQLIKPWSNQEIWSFLQEWEFLEHKVYFAVKNNRVISKAISQHLYQRGIKKSWKKCLHMLTSLQDLYWTICEANKKPRSEPLPCPYGEALHRILGYRQQDNDLSGPVCIDAADLLPPEYQPEDCLYIPPPVIFMENPQAPSPVFFMENPQVPSPVFFMENPQAPSPVIFMENPQAPSPVFFMENPQAPSPVIFMENPQAPSPVFFMENPQAPSPVFFMENPQAPSPVVFMENPQAPSPVVFMENPQAPSPVVFMENPQAPSPVVFMENPQAPSPVIFMENPQAPGWDSWNMNLPGYPTPQ